MDEEQVPAAEEEPAEERAEAAEEAPAPLVSAQAAETEEEPAEAPARPRNPVATWPFLGYLVLWAGLWTATALLLTGPEAADVPVDDPAYPLLVFAGLFLVACGPVLSGIVWLFARRRRDRGERGGLLTAALIRGAAVTLFGVVAWWAALLLVDVLRLGLV